MKIFELILLLSALLLAFGAGLHHGTPNNPTLISTCNNDLFNGTINNFDVKLQCYPSLEDFDYQIYIEELKHLLITRNDSLIWKANFISYLTKLWTDIKNIDSCRLILTQKTDNQVHSIVFLIDISNPLMNFSLSLNRHPIK
jgi:hypothetical protein